MKSIKEKAEESSLGYDEVQAPAIGRGFVLGANYVLEELEKECRRIAQLCKNHVENPVDEEDKVDSWARLDEMEYMLKFIEQLKEK
jgi:hypothetical protein